jgi:transcriptional regulator with XRE-family HTH domain
MTNIAYLLGFDGLSFNTNTRQFVPINRASNYLRKQRLHVNKILPNAQNRAARLCKSPPKYDVRPENNDNEAKEDARFSLQVLTTKWDELRLDLKRIGLVMWLQQCGHAYIKVSWDAAAGQIVTDPESGESFHEGEVRVDVVSAFEVFPDPLAKTLDDARYVIHAKVRPLDYFKIQYPEKGHLVKEEPTWLMSLQYEQRINSINSRGPSQGGLTDIAKDCAIEMVKYERPTPDHPKGRMIACANGILLEEKELPVGEIPFAKFDDILIGGKYYSEAVISHARPIQDQYNETVRRRAEWTKRLLAGKYVTARGSALAQESLNDESGEVRKAIGKKIREMRDKLGHSALRIATELKVSREAITHIETGRNNISALALWKLAILFNCDIGDFFPDVPDGFALTKVDLQKVAQEDENAATWAKRLFKKK